MLVCIDKITCGRMHKLITPKWKNKLEAVQAAVAAEVDPDKQLALQRQAQWLADTLIGIIVSEGQNEVADFK